MRGFLFLVILSFVAVIDMEDADAVRLAKEYHCDLISEYTTGSPGSGLYGFFHCPDDAFGRLKTAGKWVADSEKGTP